jgi:1-deoxy-D-xylulose-5-phosphate reductoisomerase
MKSISLLGSTGSIGLQTLDIVAHHRDQLAVAALAAGSKKLPLLAEQIVEHRPELVSVPTAADVKELKELLGPCAAGITTILHGDEGLEAVATHRDAQTVVTGVVGFLGLKPTAAAIRMGKTIAVANKETFVAAGAAIMPMVQQFGASIVPVDSEHSAIFQSLTGYTAKDVSRLWLTASGGPFRTWTREQIEHATIDDALKHPNWSMGPKITIDSATMMNKCLELIEAHHLFAMEPSGLAVLVHPQSIIHGMVEYRDGSVVAQLGSPDMRIPIAHCLGWPARIDGPAAKLDLAKIGQLTFEAPDPERFPALDLGRRALERGGAAPTILNAANEVAVAAFIDHRIGFGGISRLVEATLDAAERRNATAEPQDIDEALAIDHMARSLAHDLLPEIAAKSS